MKKTLLFFLFTLLYLQGFGQGIQFSKAVIYDDNPMIKSANNVFEQDDAIYGVVSFADAIINMPITDNPGTTVNLGYFVKINGKEIISDNKGSFGEVVPGAMFSREYNDVYGTEPIVIVFNPSDNDRYKSNIHKQGASKAFMAGLAKAGIGRHTVSVEIKFMDNGKMSQSISSGSFEIEVKKAISWQATSRFPAAKKNDAALVASMKTALKNGGWNYTVKKINIVETDWEIHRNTFGTITHRSIDTYVGFEMDDKSCKVFNISFKQAYSGSYGQTQVNGTGQSYVLDCAEIK